MKKKTIKKVTIYLALVFIFGALLGTIFHEVIGHGLAVIIFGGRITEVCIFTFQFGDSGLSVAPCIFGRINYKFLHEQTPLQYGFIIIMGSISTFIFSLFASVILLLKKLKGRIKIIFIIFSLYFLDIIFNLIIWLKPSRLHDFNNIYYYLDISIILIIPIVLFGAFTNILIIKYSIQNKKLSKEIKNILLSFLILTIFSTFIFLTYFGFEIYRFWY